MCLDIKKNAKSRIATEDIICYKRLIYKASSRTQEDLLCSYNNYEFIGIIDNIECEGKIRVDDNRVYFCTNEPILDGRYCDDKLGYEYSWIYDGNIQYIAIKSSNELQIIIECSYITPYQKADVHIGKIYTSYLQVRELTRINEIHRGLHSFAKYKDARNDGPGTIVKCIIPKDAEYYKGKFDNKTSYASNQLKYLEIIK